MMSLLILLRHPELVSGSTSPIAQSVIGAPWMLKQVQHDGLVNSLRGFVASCESNFGAQRHEGTKNFLERVFAFIFKALWSDSSTHSNFSRDDGRLVS